MRNFLAGLLLGWAVTYWYVTSPSSMRDQVADFWAWASSPPARSSRR